VLTLHKRRRQACCTCLYLLQNMGAAWISERAVSSVKSGKAAKRYGIERVSDEAA